MVLCFLVSVNFVDKLQQKDWVVGGGVGQSAGPVEEQVNQVVQIGHRAVQLSVWLVVSFQCVPTRKDCDRLDYLKLKLELVKYGGLSKSLRFRQLLTSFMVKFGLI